MQMDQAQSDGFSLTPWGGICPSWHSEWENEPILKDVLIAVQECGPSMTC